LTVTIKCIFDFTGFDANEPKHYISLWITTLLTW